MLEQWWIIHVWQAIVVIAFGGTITVECAKTLRGLIIGMSITLLCASKSFLYAFITGDYSIALVNG